MVLLGFNFTTLASGGFIASFSAFFLARYCLWYSAEPALGLLGLDSIGYCSVGKDTVVGSKDTRGVLKDESPYDGAGNG